MRLTDFFTRLKQQPKDPWETIIKRDPCVYCGRAPHELTGGGGKKFREGHATLMTVEHVTPKCLDARPPGWENKVGACWTCNHARGSAPLLLYLVTRRPQHAPGPLHAYHRALKAARRDQRALQRSLRRRPVPPLRVPLGEHGSALWFARLKIFGGDR